MFKSSFGSILDNNSEAQKSSEAEPIAQGLKRHIVGCILDKISKTKSLVCHALSMNGKFKDLKKTSMASVKGAPQHIPTLRSAPAMVFTSRLAPAQ